MGGDLLFQIDLKSRQSIYEQVINNIKRLIISGVLKTDDRIPSVRELSRTLTVNPNTVQKAYRELENQGFIYTVSGRGCFVSPESDRKADEEKLKEISAELKDLIEEMTYLGMDKKEILKTVEDLLDDNGTRPAKKIKSDQLDGGDLK